MLNTNYLFVSLFWGSVGAGYFVYGRKQRSLSASIGGVAMMAASYFIDGALVMSLACVGIAVGVYWISKRGE